MYDSLLDLSVQVFNYLTHMYSTRTREEICSHILRGINTVPRETTVKVNFAPSEKGDY